MDLASRISAVNHLIAFAFALIAPLAWGLMASRGKSRDNSFFGVRVQPGFAESEAGRAVIRRFRARLWWSGLFIAILVLLFPLRFSLGLGILLAWLPGWVFFAEAHRGVLQKGQLQPVPVLRVASLAADEEPISPWLDTLDWLCMILPPAIPLATLAFALIRGSPGAVLRFDIFFSLCLGLICAANQWALRFRARSNDWASTSAASRRFRTYLGVMTASIFMFPVTQISFFAVTATGHVDMPMYFAISFPVEAVWLIFVWRLRFWLAKHLDRQSMDPMPDAFWKWGWCYSNPYDPALVVPLRTGIGYSYNFAHFGVRLGAAVLTAVVVTSLVFSTSGLANIH